MDVLLLLMFFQLLLKSDQNGIEIPEFVKRIKNMRALKSD